MLYLTGNIFFGLEKYDYYSFYQDLSENNDVVSDRTRPGVPVLHRCVFRVYMYLISHQDIFGSDRIRIISPDPDPHPWPADPYSYLFQLNVKLNYTFSIKFLILCQNF
jgi:hypothetical protein